MITVQMIMDKLTEPVDTLSYTTDRLIAGRADRQVRRVAVTFSSSYASIRAAVDGGADLLITHEPTFYSHMDERDWLRGDAVFEEKLRFIEASGIAIYRFHDYWHRYLPDGILSGLLHTLGWEDYAREQASYVLDLPMTTAGELALEVKAALGLSALQLVGDPNQPVSVVGLSPGMEGGRRQMEKLMRYDADLLIVGETLSWETDEYVQDALAMGVGKAMLILGHMASEEPGMRNLVVLLASLFPELNSFFIPGRPSAVWV
ncbi:Nif3-like dinuclear metal center hexameric protein [Paenibacillus ferrarius]|uniref:Nif3-like dinuclear metal center hexameric protein n=1 Tax=Paenibacillus ferrarius TaxID=1469647 RepID=UPI003D27E5D2